MNTIYIVGATPAQRTEIESIIIGNTSINVILVDSIDNISKKGDLKELESPFISKSIMTLRCYDVISPLIESDIEDRKFKKEQDKLRSRNHGKFNYKRK